MFTCCQDDFLERMVVTQTLSPGSFLSWLSSLDKTRVNIEFEFHDTVM